MAGPEEQRQNAQEPHESKRSAPPGQFLSRDLESDTARFLEELRRSLKHRAEAQRRRPRRPL